MFLDMKCIPDYRVSTGHHWRAASNGLRSFQKWIKRVMLTFGSTFSHDDMFELILLFPPSSYLSGHKALGGSPKLTAYDSGRAN